MKTQTATISTVEFAGQALSFESSERLSKTLPPSFLEQFPKLTYAQAGHLRHFHNLASLPDGEWRHMGSSDPGQEDFEAYRYQLADMAYAAGLTHYHRTPALRSVFRRLSEQLIHKMMRRDVWGYWYMTSQSGIAMDPDITELRKPQPDPVIHENIMYSGHLLLMVSLHAMLFDSDAYDRDGALTFEWNPMCFGMGSETFRYDRLSLQRAILDEMERSGWMGVCCEVNVVFVICNQFPLIAMRYNDVRDGVNVVDGVLEKYKAAWEARNGGFTSVGTSEVDEFVYYWRVKQDVVVPNPLGIAANAWAGAFMNSWNSDFVHHVFPRLVDGYLTQYPDGRVGLNDAVVAKEIREAGKRARGGDERHDLTATPEAFTSAFAKVGKTVRDKRVHTPMGIKAASTDFGFALQWLSEVAPTPATSEGDFDIVEGLLRHADTFLKPNWERGGLFYPRRDGPVHDGEGNWVTMDPRTGNATIAYGRLNVRNGQKKMWDQPWTREGHHAHYPAIEGIDLSAGVDFLRSQWNEDVGALVATMKTWHGNKTSYVYSLHSALQRAKSSSAP